MAAGLPVLTANRGAMQEVGGDAVLAVDPLDTQALADGMGRLTWDESLRKSLINAGTKWSPQWTWARTADLTTGVYREMIKANQFK